LQPFFQLPGRIFWGRDQVEVELRLFNDRALNQDLEMLCAKVTQEQPRLPDGRRLLFRVQERGVLRESRYFGHLLRSKSATDRANGQGESAPIGQVR
jgi:hypothetical protein